MAAEKHALLSASASDRWLSCPPSARLEAQYPSETSSYAEEGSKAHAVCEYKLKHDILGMTDLTYPEDATEEMETYAEQYKDFVEEEFNAAKSETPDAKLFVEQRLEFQDYVPHGFGTADAIILSDTLLEIIDFKYGKGVVVDANENSQMRLYTLGAYLSFGVLYDFPSVKCVIYQPRINNIRSEDFSITDLLDWANEYVKPRALLAYEGKGKFCVGEHCRFCRAGAICRARAEAAFKVIDSEHILPPVLSDDEIPPILDKIDEVSAWLNAIFTYAQDKAIRGAKWRGYKLVEARTNRKIENADEAIRILTAAGYTRESVTQTKLKGIGELERLLTKKKFSELLGGVVVKPTGVPILVHENDKRPEISPIEEAFK